MGISNCKRLIIEDLKRWTDSKSRMLRTAIFNDNAKVVVLFRIGSYLINAPKIFAPIRFLNSLLFRHYRYKTGIQLELGTRMGGV